MSGAERPLGPPNREDPVAIVFVGGYGGLGRHARLTLIRMFPGQIDLRAARKNLPPESRPSMESLSAAATGGS